MFRWITRRLLCSWSRMLRHNRIIVAENVVTIRANSLQRETVFFCRRLLVLLSALAASHPVLMEDPIVTVQSPLEGINYWLLLQSNDTDLRSLRPILHRIPWITGTVLLSYVRCINHMPHEISEYNRDTDWLVENSNKNKLIKGRGGRGWVTQWWGVKTIG